MTPPFPTRRSSDLMITPMVAAYFLKAKGHASHGEGWLMDRYIRVLRWTLHNRWKTLLLGGGGAFAATIMAFMTLPFQFQPTIGTDYSQVRSEEHTSELQSLMRISSAVFCLK